MLLRDEVRKGKELRIAMESQSRALNKCVACYQPPVCSACRAAQTRPGTPARRAQSRAVIHMARSGSAGAMHR